MAHRLVQPIAAGACRRWATIAGPTVTGAAKRGLATRAVCHSSLRTLPGRSTLSASYLPEQWREQQQRRGFHSTLWALDDGGAAPAPAAAASGPASTPKVEELFQEVINLDMVEVHLLAELINEKLGIKISAAERARGAGGGKKKKKSEEVEKVEEKTIFDLKLTGFDAKSKIKVIKEVRAITALGLKEAKELVEGAPTTVKKDIKMEEAEELKAKLEAIGAQIEIV